MGNIVILDENTSNKIAAGEVVERPASVVKEMVENSIDAGATAISVDIKNGGITYIKVTDNGSGIDEDDVVIAFERHATSKIRNAADLESINTMGFRGEALASIASVASVELTTRKAENPTGTYVRIQGGVMKESRQIGCPSGTTFIVRDLFYNTPARFKFLKKDSTEAGYISDIIGRLALSKPDISFRLSSNNVVQLHSPGNNDLISAIYSVYGKDTAKQIWKIQYDDGKIRVNGYAGKPEIARANRNHQSIFVNGRYIRSKIISSAIDEAYKTFLMKNKFPFIVLDIWINPIHIDVNVHPTKMEVRFSEEQEVFRCIYHSIANAVIENKSINIVQLKDKDRNIFKFDNIQDSKNYNVSSSGLNIDKSSIEDSSKDSEANRKISFKAPSEYIQQNIDSKDYSHGADFKAKDFKDTDKSVNIEKNMETHGEIRKETNKEFNEGLNNVINKAMDNTGSVYRITADKPESLIENFIVPSGDKREDDKIEPPVKVVSPFTAAGEVVPVLIKNTTLEKAPSKVNILRDSRLIGQIFSTYILLQYGEKMLVIDQHAAHERVMFESLRKKYNNNESLAQMLISPVAVELTIREVKFLDEQKEFFNKLGFIYDDFGNNCIILRSIPYIMDCGNIQQEFCSIVDNLINSVTDDFKTVSDEQLYTIACKAAVKANKKLDELEIDNLIKELSKMENPYTCPHGRPTILEITKYEIEKMFKRIV